MSWNPKDPYDWKGRHDRAMAHPVGIERHIVRYLNDVRDMVIRYGDDGVMREAPAHMIEAVHRLLDADLGMRLDMGTISSELRTMAESIGWDRDMQRFTDDLEPR